MYRNLFGGVRQTGTPLLQQHGLDEFVNSSITRLAM